MSKDKIKISLVLCTYNRTPFLPKVLETIKNQTASKNDYELVIINNNSSDNTDEFCQNYISENPDLSITYFIERNQGLSFAKNAGIEKSQGDVVAFVDDDAYVNPEYVENLISFFSEYKHVSALGGKIIPVYEDKPSWVSKYIEPIFGGLNYGDEIIEFKKNKYPFGGNSAVRKEIFEKYGNFNTKLGRIGKKMLAGEEKDFYLRIKKGGEKLFYHPQVILYHITPNARTTMHFVKNQAKGLGVSDKIRVSQEGKKAKFSLYFSELYKWVGSMFLFFIFLLKFQFPKGFMILKFRWWVSSGMFWK